MTELKPNPNQYLQPPESRGSYNPKIGYYLFRGINHTYDPVPDRGKPNSSVCELWINWTESWVYAQLFSGKDTTEGTLIVAHISDEELEHLLPSVTEMRKELALTDAADLALPIMPANTRIITEDDLKALQSLTPPGKEHGIRDREGVNWRGIAHAAIGHTFNSEISS